MNGLAFRGLLERKVRTAFTLLAVVLGVALIAGTFVLTDTISKSFDTLVATAGENVDVKVLSPNADGGFDGTTASSTFAASVETQVRDVAGVAAVAGAFRELPVTLVDGRGERVGPTQGAPTLAFSAVPERFDPFEYTGRSPRADGEIAISEKAATDAGVEVGDRIRVQGTQSIRAYEVVGIATFGGAGSAGGAGFTVLTLPEVQVLAGEFGKVTEIDVQAEPGVTQAELKRRVSERVGGTVLVRTGAEDSQQASQDLSRSSGSSRSGCSSSV